MKIIFILMCLSSHSTAYKILGLFPLPVYSHFNAFKPVLRGLADVGHDVTVLSYFPHENPPKNYKDIIMGEYKPLATLINLDNFATNSWLNVYREFLFLHDKGVKSCMFVLNSTAILNLLNSKIKYDVILLENFNTDCLLAVAYKLKSPFIGTSSGPLLPWYYDRISNPTIPSYIPSLFMEHNEKMSFLERFGNLLSAYSLKILYRNLSEREANKQIKKYLGDGIPDVAELSKMTSLILVNQHYTYSGAKPTSKQLIEVGGVHLEKPKPLDPELQHFLDSAKDGVIYISWGSCIRADSMPIEKREALVKTFSKFKQKFLWKFESEEIKNLSSNVLIKKWLPQRDILCHRNVKLFMTHGGLLGTTEAVHCAVPVIITPIYGDQFLNGAALKMRGVASIIHYSNFTEDNIYNNIQDGLKKEKKQYAKKLAYAFNNRPQSPLKTAIWWIEHVAATNGKIYASSYATELSWFTYHSIDVYLTLLVILCLCIWSLKVVVRKCLLIREKNKIKKS